MPERRGYTSFHGDPVDRHGTPEHYSGRINHRRMDAYANRDSLNFKNFARYHADELYSTTSTDYQNIPPQEHPYRSEPSQTSERRARGYNPAWQGSVRSSGSNPQSHDESYADECTAFPPGTPMGDSCQKYKSLEWEGEHREKFYHAQAKRYAKEATHYAPPHRRQFKGIDDYHRRAENTAFRTADNFHEASKARNEHNAKYMGHFKGRWDFDRHEQAATTNKIKSEGWHAAENAHRDLRPRDPPRRPSKFERKMRSMLDEAYPEEP